MKRLRGTSLKEQSEAGFVRWCWETTCAVFIDFPYKDAAMHILVVLLWIICVLTLPVSIPLIALSQMLDARKRLEDMRAMLAEMEVNRP